MQINWNDIPCFLAIAEAGSLAGAARTLGVNHSTVFRRLNALEDGIGSRVFDRLPEGYRLTETGEDLLHHAYQAQNAVDGFARTALGRDTALSGEVRLTAAPNLAIQHIPPVLARLRQAQPGIRVEVIVSDSDYDLARREADLALRATSRPPDYLVGRKVVELRWYVMGAPAYLADHGTPLSLAELDEHSLIGADQAFQRLDIFRWLHRRFPREQFVATSNSLSTMASMAIAGVGLAVLPSDQVDENLQRLFAVDTPNPAALWLLTHPDLRNVARIRAVSDALYDQFSGDVRLK